MGLQLPKRGKALRRVGATALVSAGLLMLGACSTQDQDQIKRLAMPVPITDRAPLTNDLWRWAWLAAILVGILVWGLILYAAFRYRRRSEDEIPVQTRYNLPIEILYTIAPVVMVVVFFFFTVQTQDGVLAAPAGGKADHTVKVVGQKWSWSFNYLGEKATGGKDVFVSGTPAQFPTLVLPKGQSVTFQLRSADVIHSFWVPSFLMKMDVVPGRHNSFTITPTREGTFAGKCAELCGTYHSRMLFNLKVVSPAQYDQYLRGLVQQGNVGDLNGASSVTTEAGLQNDSQQGAQQ